MLGMLKKLRRDERGNVLIIMGAALPVLIGFVGLATDTIQWTLWKRQLQRAADSAAVAGVYERLQTEGKDTNVAAAVERDLGLNNHVGTLYEPAKVETTGITLATGQINPVRVTLKYKQPLTFSSMFMSDAPIIEARSTAASLPGTDEYCVIALDRSAKVTGLTIGGSTKLDIGECAMIANSSNPNNAADNTGVGSTVNAKALAAAGGVNYSKKNWVVEDYLPYSQPVADPFEKLEPPKNCDVNVASLPISANSNVDRTASGVNDAGKVVCIKGGLDIKGNLKLAAATYVIDGGDISMNSTKASLTCDGCTIIMTNKANAANTGNIKLTGGTLDLKAPTTGDYAGISLMQDRGATDDGSKSQNHINGNNNASVTGTIYLPNRSLLYNGGGEVQAGRAKDPGCVQIIGKRLEFTGNSGIKMTSKCGNGMKKVPAGVRVRLVA